MKNAILTVLHHIPGHIVSPIYIIHYYYYSFTHYNICQKKDKQKYQFLYIFISKANHVLFL